MAKLFRKGRFNFFQGKGWGQYVLYILLEMLLVVAGILIALEINNANERSKNEDKATAIMHELRRDLRHNLLDLDKMIENLELKDSLMTRVLRDSVTRDDYRQNFAYAGLTMTYLTMNFQDNGFGSMTRQSEIFSRDFDTLFTNLERLYQGNYGLVESMQERLGDFVVGTLERWSTEKPWLHELSSGRLSEEALDFFLDDPFYLNTVDLYRTYSSLNMLSSMREAKLKTSLAIVELNQILEPKEDPYAEFEDYLCKPDLAFWAQDTGYYDLASVVRFQLKLDGEHIRMGQVGQPMMEVYPRNDSLLFLPVADLKLVFHRQKKEIDIVSKQGVQTLKKMNNQE